MRPLRLTIEGFTSFREPTTVDFTDADYFALVGPTGSGKSSLIDAIAFALYGAVPRYEDRRLVAPVITQGRTEARVGLDFAVGSERYRVVRVVRAAGAGRGRARASQRTSTTAAKGATTKEARLERLGRAAAVAAAVAVPDEQAEVLEVLAGDADGVTAAVSRLLGLSFEHFIKCVVLPQGAFARFLHDKPAVRQDLLVELLGLGVYGQLGQRANQEAAAAGNQVALAEQQLARPPLSDATVDALHEAAARVAELTRIQDEVVAAEPVLAALAARQAEAEGAARMAQGRAASLAALVSAAADGLVDRDDLGAGLDRAGIEVSEAETAAAVAEQQTQEAETALGQLPPRSTLDAAQRAHEERQEVLDRLQKGRRLTAELAVAERRLAAEMEAAGAEVATARLGREALIEAHQAASLTRNLVAGEPCPVCHQVVHEVPVDAPLLDLERASHAVLVAEKLAEEAVGQHREAAIRRAKSEEKLELLVERLTGLEAALAESPDCQAVRALVGTVAAAEATVTAARQAERGARAHLRQMTECLATRQAEVRRAWERLDDVRDTVGALGPPPIDRTDLPGAWQTLADWAEQRRPQEDEVAAASLSLVAGLAAEHTERLAALAETCRLAGIDPGPARPLAEVLAGALAAAQSEADRRRAMLIEADRLRTELVQAQEEAQVAHLLGQHLKSSGFEKWLLDEVLAELVAGATALLRELSAGAYSLTLDDAGGFAVIDHRNADLVRSARTLSGGETFLASLALALALADRLASFAADGAAPLEAIFLDEGFGTLDPDTLDTVAAAIENLAADGRVVGLVTHVRDLADRIPVRFEVEKGPTTSTIRRVEG